MSTPLSELRDYRTTTRRMLSEGDDPLSVSLAADSRLVEVANQVAICHRVLAEARADLRHSFFPDRKRLESKIREAGDVLVELEEIQSELIDVKSECVKRTRAELARINQVINELLGKR
mgnify:CR=1 FL=1